jgi:phosphogluconate dehydratase
MFDGALLLGVCDKIVPGLVIGALPFGHLPCILIPAGPMPSGLSNSEKAEIRQLDAQGKVAPEALLTCESKAYHSAGTCTFYGTANSNQMLMGILGLHIPGAAFINAGTPLRAALARAAARRITQITALGPSPIAIGACWMNVALSTPLSVCWRPAARPTTPCTLFPWPKPLASAVVPLLARVYPNGSTDVNHFHAAGGLGYIIRELLDAGLQHEDVGTVMGTGLRAYAREPWLANGVLAWREAPAAPLDDSIVRPVSRPCSPDGGLKLVQGNLGRAVLKTSAVPSDRYVIEAPAAVFDSRAEVEQAFTTGELDRDVIVVVRFQGPRANGMPELHKLTPALGVLSDKGYKVALVTDGRMSGASGKIPAAIHVSPECLAGGPLAKLRNGDIVCLDALSGKLEALVAAADWNERVPAQPDVSDTEHGWGRELFSLFRRHARAAEEGGSVLL